MPMSSVCHCPSFRTLTIPNSPGQTLLKWRFTRSLVKLN